jgi:hypothetical protein
MIAFDYGAWEAIGVPPHAPQIMFDEFLRLSQFWQASSGQDANP